MSREGASFQRARFVVDPDSREEIEAQLVLGGCLGWQLFDEREPPEIEAYFPIDSALPEAVTSAARVDVLEDRDWLASYRDTSPRHLLGQRFVVYSGHRDGAAPNESLEGRTPLNIPAERAFGTGSHATTALVVEALESLDLTGWQLLDVGSGSGILGIVAQRLGARGVLGFDTDLSAPFIARRNARHHGGSLALYAGTVAALGSEAEGRFDLACVNVLPHNLKGAEASIARLVRPPRRVIASGWTLDSEARALESWSSCGLESLSRFAREEWVCHLLSGRSRA